MNTAGDVPGAVYSRPLTLPTAGGPTVNEIIFVVEEAPEGGYTAAALGASIFTEADDLTNLEAQVRDAVLCHYDDEATRPRIIRLHFVREEVIAI